MSFDNYVEPKIFTSPQVRLIGVSAIDRAEVGQFLKEHDMAWPVDTESDAELLTEFGGRICYMSFGKGRKSFEEYSRHILESGHGSVLEHAVFNFAIWGVSRSLTHELVRHRAGTGFSQLSQRYVDESTAEYVVPPLFNRPEYIERFKTDISTVHQLYLKWAGIAGEIIDEHFPHLQGTDRRKNMRQAARGFLPNATETKMLFTCNVRALRHIVENRASVHADMEIRGLAVKMFKIAKEQAPFLFQDYKIESLPDGTEAVTGSYRKV